MWAGSYGVPTTRSPGKPGFYHFMRSPPAVHQPCPDGQGIRHCAEPGDALIMPLSCTHSVKRQHGVKITPSSLCRTSPCSCPEATTGQHLRQTYGKVFLACFMGSSPKHAHVFSPRELGTAKLEQISICLRNNHMRQDYDFPILQMSNWGKERLSNCKGPTGY